MSEKNNKPKALIIIGGSYLQLPQIHWARELGLYVIVTDQNPDVPGQEIADQFELINGTDISAFLSLAFEIEKKYQLIGIYSGSDFGLPVVATVSQQLNLPSCSPEAVERALNKSTARQTWLNNGLPVPRGLKIDSQARAVTAVTKIGLPVIIKPVNGSGSRGICSVNRMNELTGALADAQTVSHEILMEELISGRHIDVNGLFVNGIFQECGISERFFSPQPFHYPLWGYQEAVLECEHTAVIYQLVEKAARCLGIEAGPIKADMILTATGPILIEMSPRFHGDIGTSFVTPLATGASPVKAYFAFLAGQRNASELLQPNLSKLAGWIALFPDVHGRLKTVTGMEQVKQMKDIAHIFIRAQQGWQMKPPKDNTALAGFVVACGENLEQLKNTLKTAAKSITFMCE
jgi:biotin carboxylase